MSGLPQPALWSSDPSVTRVLRTIPVNQPTPTADYHLVVAAPETSISQGERSERRARPRHLMHAPVYATLNGCNGGLLLDLSQSGLGVQAVAPLHNDETILLRFELQRPRTRVEAAARVAWASPSGQAGLRFAGMSPQTQRSLQSWLMSTAAAAQSANRLQPEFFPVARQEPREDTSAASCPLIPPVADETAQPTGADTTASVAVPLWPRPISTRTLASLADAMIVLLAVLIFSVISVSTSGVAPGWPLWVIAGVVLTGFFGFLYRYLFATYAGGTAGQRLAGWGPEEGPPGESSGTGSTE